MKQTTGLALKWIVATATALAVLSGALAYNLTQSLGRPIRIWYALVVLNLFYWYTWAFFAPAVGWLTVRFRFDRARWKRAIPVHVTAVIVFSVAHIFLMVGFQYLFPTRVWDLSFATVLINTIVQTFDTEMMNYWVIVGVTHAALYYQESRQRALTAAQLQTRLAQAQLKSLQAQLHPHFFFNTLHAISALMRRDVAAADRMLTRLSELLRLSLDRTGVAEVTLQEEIEFLEKYVEIECTRFQDRLTVRFDIAPDTLRALVPNLVLQPIVENAIRHGIAPRSGPGRVDVIARHENGHLTMEVRDDGVGLTEDAFVALQKGIGVSTTRARLQHQYGSRYRFEFMRHQPGLTVRIAVPWRTAVAGQPAAQGGTP